MFLILLFTLMTSSIFGKFVQISCPPRPESLELTELYLAHNAEAGDTVQMSCECQRGNETRIWYRADRLWPLIDPELMEVWHLGENMTLSFDLLLQNVTLDDTALYFCRSGFSNEMSDVYVVVLDVFQNYPDLIYGDFKGLNDYMAKYFKTDAYAYIAKRNEPWKSYFKNYTLEINATIVWLPRGECDGCERRRTVVGQCRIDTIVHDVSKCVAPCDVLRHLFKAPCQSITVSNFDEGLWSLFGGMANYAYTFTCLGICKKEAREDNVKQVVIREMYDGTSVSYLCPGHDLNKESFWRRNDMKLDTTYSSYSKVLVDEFGILHLFQVTTEESGNYTCYVDGGKRLENIVIVRQYFTKQFGYVIRHVFYLFYTFFLSFVIWSGVMVVKYVHRTDYKQVTDEQVIRRFRDKKYAFEFLQNQPENFNSS